MSYDPVQLDTSKNRISDVGLGEDWSDSAYLTAKVDVFV